MSGVITPAFTKLQRSIVTSSIWLESGPTRLVWITLLAICDRDGIARCSQRMLAHTARVTDEECDQAVALLLAPDPDSRDRGDGRRVEIVEGGFLILNYLKKLSEGAVADRREYFREKKAESRAKQKANGGTIRVKKAPKNEPRNDPRFPIAPEESSNGF